MSSRILCPRLFSRRNFVKSTGIASLFGLNASRIFAAGQSSAPPLFEEVAPAASGITWSHDNGMSPERYLPETLGPGCAFLDYDNDGWMDIYLVNSGPFRLLQTKSADPQRALQK
ncbi:MAG: VCBS repeat-containing protein [Pyrinomonadaceae bacterium]